MEWPAAGQTETDMFSLTANAAWGLVLGPACHAALATKVRRLTVRGLRREAHTEINRWLCHLSCHLI